MKKISINMLSVADIVKGQGVETAYNELISLLNKFGKDKLEIVRNKGLKYDILHMHTCNIMSYIKQRLTKGVTLTYVHFLPNTLDGALKISKIFKDIYSWWVKKCYLKSDYLVVVNPNYKEEMVKLGFDKDKIFYVPNYVSNDNFFVIKDKDKLREKYGYSKDDFIVISIGQLHKGKGVLDFIDIAKKNKDIKFLWVGGFNFGRAMEGYKEIKKVYDSPLPNIKFTGVVDRSVVNEYCNMSDVFFSPSYYESFSLVTLEASHTELPIILRNLDNYKGIYDGNVLYGNNNIEFTKLIRKLKDDKKEYKKYVQKSINIKEDFNEKKIFDKWIDLYSKIAK